MGPRRQSNRGKRRATSTKVRKRAKAASQESQKRSRLRDESRQSESRGLMAIQGIVKDGTGRRRMEEELQRVSQFIETILENANVSFNVLDENANVIVWNEAAELMTGYTREEVLGHAKIWQWLYPDEQYRKKITDEVADVMRRGRLDQDIETRIKRKDGQSRIISWNQRNLLDEHGKVTGSVTIGRDITERKRMEEELRRLNQFFETIIDNANIWLDVLDEKAGVVIWNKAAEVISGYRREELIGHGKIWEWLYPDEKYRNYLTERVRDLIQHGRVDQDFETRILRKDGEARIISWNERGLLDEHAKVIGSIAIGRDVTEQKKMQEQLDRYSRQLENLVEERTKKLAESEEKYRSLVENIPDVAWTTDPDGRTTFVSPNVTRIVGRTPEEIYAAGGTLWLERMHPDDIGRVREAYEALFARNEPYDVEYRIQRKDGEWIWLHDRSVATYEKDGRQYADGLLSGITERKRIERQIADALLKLRESETNFRALYDSIADGIIYNDVPGRIFECNRAFEKMVGYSVDELRKMKWQDITPKQYLELEEGIVREDMLKRGFSTYVEKEYIRKDGTRIPVETTASIVRGTGGNPDMIWCIIRDITERKRMEKQFLESRRLAAIGETAAMVGHDLRNPLQAISGAAYLLKSNFGPAMDEKTRDLLEVIEKGVEHSDSIVRDLLEYAGEIRLERAIASPKSITDAALSEVRIPENVRIVDSTEGVPTVTVDVHKMQRVFANLIKNAVEAMPEGGTLAISSRPTDRAMEVTFADTGTGMTKETLEKIWTPLFTTKSKGMGLGLAITRRIVEAHGGTITADTAVGKGSTFRVMLPVKPAAM